MEKINQVDVLDWRYKGTDKKERHIGSIAEDFYKLFPLDPDYKHINPRDVASIALLAAKELQKDADIAQADIEANKAKDAALNKRLEIETAKLKAENESLKQRLSSLEKLVTSLASAEGTLISQGEKVALNK